VSDVPVIKTDKPTRQWLRDKKIVPAYVEPEKPSGLSDKQVIGWDRFLQAFSKDHPRGLNARLVPALQSFVLQWTFIGRGTHTIEVDMGGEERDEDIQTVECPGMPDFTYNREGVKSIQQLKLTYGEWKGAVGDLKLNLSGSSYGDEVGKHEHLHWGGPVDVGEEPIFLDDDNEAINKVFDL